MSDGTLRYLLLLAALLTRRAPGLMVLNEPETSLHPQLLKPLARLIGDAAQRCQIIVVTHAGPLVEALAEAGSLRHELTKTLGETTVDGLARASWEWPSR
ncbi:MAG: ATP-binding protein [Hyphomicrobiales bacterium]|nr:ATP-binding protein [Hyphomicrobiales bacterium]